MLVYGAGLHNQTSVVVFFFFFQFFEGFRYFILFFVEGVRVEIRSQFRSFPGRLLLSLVVAVALVVLRSDPSMSVNLSVPFFLRACWVLLQFLRIAE